MRVTVVCFRQHLGRQFKAHWLIQGYRRVGKTQAEAVLASRGIPVVDPSEVLSHHIPRQHVEVEVPRLAEAREPEKGQEGKMETVHWLNNHFSPVGGMAQAQHLTNSLVYPDLPDGVLAQAAAHTFPEHLHQAAREAILSAHLLDSFQQKLPRVLDVINHPGWKFPVEYGIPQKRRNKSLTYKLLLLLDQLVPEAAGRHLAEDTITQVTLPHSGRLLRLDHRAGFVLSSQRPLAQVAGPAAVAEAAGQPLPDIHPLSPFIHCKTSNTKEDCYAVPSSKLHPHTVFIHHNSPIFRHFDEQFRARSLLYAFSHAAAYAKQVLQVSSGDLKVPVVVQVVHTYHQYHHLAVFQLNTLDLVGPTRNMLWTQPWMKLYERCAFQVAAPVLEGYNPYLLSLLHGLHAQ